MGAPFFVVVLSIALTVDQPRGKDIMLCRAECQTIAHADQMSI
jgi:hypothetical protein